MMLRFYAILLHNSWWLLNASYFFYFSCLCLLSWNFRHVLGSWAVSQGLLWKQSRMVQARRVISLRHDFDALSFHVVSVVSAFSPSFSSSLRLYKRKVLPRLSSLERNWAQGDIKLKHLTLTALDDTEWCLECSSVFRSYFWHWCGWCGELSCLAAFYYPAFLLCATVLAADIRISEDKEPLKMVAQAEIERCDKPKSDWYLLSWSFLWLD